MGLWLVMGWLGVLGRMEVVVVGKYSVEVVGSCWVEPFVVAVERQLVGLHCCWRLGCRALRIPGLDPW
jgi:hypothetical protein